jgi:plasmid stabilization system protein ParE
MKYNVRIVKPAQTDMRETYKYISGKLCNKAAADRLLAQIDKGIQSLRVNPQRFPLVRDAYLASRGYRHIIVKNHMVFFIIREEEHAVSVMRVLYGRRDWLGMLKDDIGEQDKP